MLQRHALALLIAAGVSQGALSNIFPANAAHSPGRPTGTLLAMTPVNCATSELACARQAYKLADLRMTLTINKIRQKLGSLHPAKMKAFTDDQTAWGTARDKLCPAAVSAHPGTDAYQIGLYHCLRDVTNDRRIAIEAMIDRLP